MTEPPVQAIESMESIPPPVVSAAWLNSVQEEIVSVIEKARGTQPGPVWLRHGYPPLDERR